MVSHIWYRIRLQRASVHSAVLMSTFVLLLVHRAWEFPVELVRLYSELAGGGGSRCILPRLDPWAPEIQKHVWAAPPLQCRRLQEPLATLSGGRLRLNASAADLRCRFRPFAHNAGADDDSHRFGDWAILGGEAEAKSDFVEVECRRGVLDLAVYHDFLASVRPLRGHPDVGDPNAPKRQVFGIAGPVDSPKPQLSVLMLGIDSMSKENMRRQMPETESVLMKELGGVSFRGHTKVGDNTIINHVAILAGKRFGDTGDFKTELKHDSTEFFDHWGPLIWDSFAARGYATLYAEDRPDICSFNYLGMEKGFRFPPTTHYLRPWWTSVWWTTLHRRSAAFCYGESPEHRLQLDYTESFVQGYAAAGRRFFGFSWLNGLSHDALNAVGASDSDVVGLLRRLKASGALETTALIFFSDHGHRYASIRETVQGRVEARMPFLAIVLPPWLKAKYPALEENMRINAERMTSQFDLHATLRHLLSADFAAVDTDEARQLGSDERAYSLLRRVPMERSCAAAHIPLQFCPCEHELRLAATDPRLVAAATAFVGLLNAAVDADACARIRLSSVLDGSLLLPNPGTFRDPQTQRRIPRDGLHFFVRLAVLTEPRGARFESLLRQDLGGSGGFSLAADVDRTNAYGNSSHCVAQDPLKRKICTCLPGL